MERLFSAFWVPVLAIALVVAVIVGIGEMLLALADMEPELAGVKEPYAVVGGLVITVVILLGATLVARSGRRS